MIEETFTSDEGNEQLFDVCKKKMVKIEKLNSEKTAAWKINRVFLIGVTFLKFGIFGKN